MNKPIIREWMKSCPDCVPLVQALIDADFEQPTPTLRAFEAVRDHLVGDHLERLPEYAEECANCQEWKGMETDMLSAGAVMVLAREALLHRAGHLLYDQKGA